MAGSVRLDIRKMVISERVVGPQACLDSGHSPKLSEFKKYLDNAIRHKVSFWVILCGAQGWTRCRSLAAGDVPWFFHSNMSFVPRKIE